MRTVAVALLALGLAGCLHGDEAASRYDVGISTDLRVEAHLEAAYAGEPSGIRAHDAENATLGYARAGSLSLVFPEVNASLQLGRGERVLAAALRSECAFRWEAEHSEEAHVTRFVGFLVHPDGAPSTATFVEPCGGRLVIGPLRIVGP